MLTAHRYHDFSCGHRVHGHESKCAHLHGHNYRVTFGIASKDGLDSVGRVMDFSVIKDKFVDWLEENWDHKFLIFKEDPLAPVLHDADPEGVVVVGFNPTAENMADWILYVLAPLVLSDTNCYLQEVIVEETRKCSVKSSLK